MALVHLQSFERSIQNESTLDQISTQIQFIKKTLSNAQIRITHPRDIYPFYQTLMKVTAAVSSCNSTIRSQWEQTLQGFQGLRIYCVGHGISRVDISPALRLLTIGTPPQIRIEMLKVHDSLMLQETLKSMMEIDREGLGAYFSKGFLSSLLKASGTRCVIAREVQTGRIVGNCWGTILKIQGLTIFHVWGMGRKANMAEFGIAHLLKEQGMQLLVSEQPTPQFQTLNVDPNQSHAIQLYQKWNFTKQLVEPARKDKMLMVRSLGQYAWTTNVASQIWPAMRQYTMTHVALPKLIFYEIMRQCILLIKKIYYR